LTANSAAAPPIWDTPARTLVVTESVIAAAAPPIRRRLI
jgi:hypothetical protein